MSYITPYINAQHHPEFPNPNLSSTSNAPNPEGLSGMCVHLYYCNYKYTYVHHPYPYSLEILPTLIVSSPKAA